MGSPSAGGAADLQTVEHQVCENLPHLLVGSPAGRMQKVPAPAPFPLSARKKNPRPPRCQSQHGVYSTIILGAEPESSHPGIKPFLVKVIWSFLCSIRKVFCPNTYDIPRELIQWEVIEGCLAEVIVTPE